MAKVHLLLQGKGGVGKSLIASLIAQYLHAQGTPPVCVDTDPVNATLMGYKSLDPVRVELMDGSMLVERRFDGLVERIIADDVDYVVDNGASSFLPLSNYLVENDAIRVLKEHGKDVIVHTVVTGGQALMDTLSGLNSLATQLPTEADLVVWLNHYFGHVEADGKRFEDMKVYRQHHGRIKGIVQIPRQTSSTYGKDMEAMLDQRLTFADVAARSDFGLMAKSRLATMSRIIFEQLPVVL